jgi:hypothetical protein
MYRCFQRWALKRPGGSTKPASTKHASVGLEERSAALKALSLAVGPMRGSSALRSGNLYYLRSQILPLVHYSTKTRQIKKNRGSIIEF